MLHLAYYTARRSLSLASCPEWISEDNSTRILYSNREEEVKQDIFNLKYYEPGRDQTLSSRITADSTTLPLTVIRYAV